MDDKNDSNCSVNSAEVMSCGTRFMAQLVRYNASPIKTKFLVASTKKPASRKEWNQFCSGRFF